MTSGFNRITPRPLFFAWGPPRSLVGAGVPQRVLIRAKGSTAGHMSASCSFAGASHGAESQWCRSGRISEDSPSISWRRLVSVIALGVCTFASCRHSSASPAPSAFRMHALRASVDGCVDGCSVLLCSSVRRVCRVSVHFGEPGRSTIGQAADGHGNRNRSRQPRLLQLLRTNLGDARLTCSLGIFTSSAIELSPQGRAGSQEPDARLAVAI